MQDGARRLRPVINAHPEGAVFMGNLIEKHFERQKIWRIRPALSVPAWASHYSRASGAPFFEVHDDTAQKFSSVCLTVQVNESAFAHAFVHVNSNRPGANEDCFGEGIVADQEAHFASANSRGDGMRSCFKPASSIPKMAKVGSRRNWRVPDTELNAILHRRAWSC